MTTQKNTFGQLITLIETLRSPGGCPWDQKQTLDSLKRYLQEESTELLEAIDRDNSREICEELGDLLYIILFMCRIGHEENRFSYDDMLGGIQRKLIRRHPHVFADAPTGDEQMLRKQWERIKAEEKKNKK